jgi:nitrate reductase NapE component
MPEEEYGGFETAGERRREKPLSPRPDPSEDWMEADEEDLAELDEVVPEFEDELLTAQSNEGRSIYAEYIKEQLDAQEARKVSLEQRGLAVITTSGVLVTLLFGLTALSVRRESTFVIPNAAAGLLIVALVFFVLAALCAIVTNLPRSYEAVTVDGLRRAVNERWEDSEAVASEMVALTRLKMLASAKKNNDAKGIALVIAMSLEILAVALVGAAVGFVLWE